MSAEGDWSDVQRLKKGDEGVLESLVRRLGPSVEGMLNKRFPKLRPYVEDLLAESLHRLWVGRDKYDPGKGSLLTWWLANAALDLLRSGWQQARAVEASQDSSRLDQIPESWAGFPGETPAEPGPADLSAAADLQAVLAALSDVDMRIMMAYAQANGTGAWAADLTEELRLSANAIRVRRLRIQRYIEEEMQRRGHALPSDKRD